jgi:hypothetical protein
MNLTNWRENLAQILSASAQHESFDHAAVQLVSRSAMDLAYHEASVYALEQGIRAAGTADKAVIDIIRSSGYQVQSTLEAADLISHLLCCYLTEYCQAVDLTDAFSSDASACSDDVERLAGSKQIELRLTDSEARMMLEALAALEEKWQTISASSDDGPAVAEHGGDLIELRLLIKKLRG